MSIILNSYCFSTPYTVPSNSNVKWDQAHPPDVDAVNGIIIPYNSTLEINGITIIFNTGSEIIVEIGARLKVVKCTLTAASQSTWNGIEIMGDSTSSQSFINKTQGYVCIHQAYIQNTSEQAIWVQSGAILIAYNTKFEFNKVSIKFDPYTNPSNPNRRNYSCINGCTFSYSSVNIPNNNTFADRSAYKHIYIDGIKGLRIIGCKFIGCFYGYRNFIKWSIGIGIYALNSSFTVEKDDNPATLSMEWIPYCIPDGAIGKFSRLEYGIISESCNNIKVRGCKFDSVQRPISFSWDINTLIFDNEFNFGYPFLGGVGECYANESNVPEFIYLYYSRHFNITENYFNKYYERYACWTDQAPSYLVNVVLPIAPPESASLIHNNYFILSDTDCPNDRTSGLKIELPQYIDPYNSIANIIITCNHFTNYEFKYGIWVTGNGRLHDMGSSTESSGNLFNSTHGISAFDIFYSPDDSGLPNLECYYSLDDLNYYYPYRYPGLSYVNNVDLNVVTSIANCQNYDPCAYYESIYSTVCNSTVIDVIQKRKIIIIEKDTFLEHVYDPEYFKVHVNLSPNPSSSDITLSLSSNIKYYENYSVSIFDENQNQKYSHTFSGDDSNVVFNHTLIGSAGTYNCLVTFEDETDTNIEFVLTDSITVTIYPNPTYGDVNISLTGIDNYQNYTVMIYDQYNTLKYEHIYGSNDNPILIQRSSIGTDGIYTCAIIVNSRIVYATFILMTSE
jgi:hypothetical protein